jgi:hypothetical protein
VWKLCVFCGKKAAFRGFFNAFRDLNYGLLWIHSLFGFCRLSGTKAPGKKFRKGFPATTKIKKYRIFDAPDSLVFRHRRGF